MPISDRILELRRVRAGDLAPSADNWREHPESQRKALQGILAEVGYTDAVLTYTAPDGRLTLFDGHLRQSLDPEQVIPVLVTDLTEAEARKMMAVLDPLAGMAEANAEKLAALIAEIETESADVRAMLEALAAENPVETETPPTADPEPQIDRAAELQKQWGTEQGQLWTIPGKAGVHRVLCGDSTKAEDVERLMAGAKADLCFTSPPYNLGNNHHTAEKKTQAYDDALPENEYQAMQAAVLDLIAANVIGDLFYQHKHRIKNKRWLTPLDWIRRAPWKIVQEIVWINGGPNMDPCRFYPQTERIWWLTRENTTTRFENVGKFTDWWQVNPVGTDGAHTRAFPAELPSRIIQSVNADLIFDPFLGSGTTLIAAENLSRICYGMEISPAYVAVILQRAADANLSPVMSDAPAKPKRRSKAPSP